MEKLLLCAAIILFNNQLLHVTAVQSYPVRLTGGSNVYEGLVEVLYCVNNSSCAWRTVCASDWDSTEASVTCSQLGLYNSTTAAISVSCIGLCVSAPTASYSTGHINSNAVSITCTSSAHVALGYCSVSSRTFCRSNRRAKVQCSSPPQIPTFGRLSFTIEITISATIPWTVTTTGRSRHATKYQVKCSNDGYNSRTVFSTYTTLHGLQQCTLHTCCVGGIDTDGAVGAVNCISFRTPFSTMSVPEIPTFLDIQSRSVTLQWQPLSTGERCNPPILYSVKVEGPQLPLCNGQQRIESNIANTNTIIAGLCPYSSYRISVKACAANMCGEYSRSITVRTLEDVPTNVNNLRCNTSSSTQVNISWEHPTQTNGVIRFYEVILNNINTTLNTTKYVESDTTTIIINHLHPNHHYLCSVAVYSAVGRNISSTQYVMLRQSSPTGVPEQFTCSPQGPTSLVLQLNWREPNSLEQNGPIENYSVLIWNLDTNEVVYSNFTTYTSLTIGSLASYHNYKCAVAANGQLGLGPFDDRQVWISKTNHNFGPPSNLQANRVTSRTFRVIWSEPTIRYNSTRRIDNYQVRVFDYQENRTISSRTYTQQYSDHEEGSLHPNYHYQIDVSAIVAGARGPVASYSIQTSEDTPSGAPQNLSYLNVTSSSFTLTWNAPPFEEQNGDIVGYIAQVTLHNSRPDEHSHVTVTALSFTVTSLTQNTRYNASVAAMTRVGTGPYSAPISIDTMKLGSSSLHEVGVIASVILSVLFVVAMILLISVSLGLGWHVRKSKKIYKVQSEVLQLQDYRQVNSSTEVIENALPQEQTSYEYNALTKRKVKPPAVPPKTYLEPNMETMGEIETPSDEEAVQGDDGDVDTCSVGSDSLYDMKLKKIDFQLPEQVVSVQGADGDVDTCSAGSDSLYDMKLEKIDFQLPERVVSAARKPTQAIRDKSLIPHRNLPHIQTTGTDPQKPLKLTKQELVDHESKTDLQLPERVVSAASGPARAMVIQVDKNLIPPRNLPHIQATETDYQNVFKLTKRELVDHESNHRCDSKESDYQKLETKTLAPPNKYEDIQNLPSKLLHQDKATKSWHASAAQESQYEPLRRKTMNKESEYQEILPKKTH